MKKSFSNIFHVSAYTAEIIKTIYNKGIFGLGIKEIQDIYKSDPEKALTAVNLLKKFGIVRIDTYHPQDDYVFLSKMSMEAIKTNTPIAKINVGYEVELHCYVEYEWYVCSVGCSDEICPYGWFGEEISCRGMSEEEAYQKAKEEFEIRISDFFLLEAFEDSLTVFEEPFFEEPFYGSREVLSYE